MKPFSSQAMKSSNFKWKGKIEGKKIAFTTLGVAEHNSALLDEPFATFGSPGTVEGLEAEEGAGAGSTAIPAAIGVEKKELTIRWGLRNGFGQPVVKIAKKFTIEKNGTEIKVFAQFAKSLYPLFKAGATITKEELFERPMGSGVWCFRVLSTVNVASGFSKLKLEAGAKWEGFSAGVEVEASHFGFESEYSEKDMICTNGEEEDETLKA